MSSLEHAITIAASAHAGYRSNNDEPYILHPLRVMLGLKAEDERIVAVLHDVVEKTGWTLANLKDEGFPERILEAIDAVTRRHGEAYFDFVQRTRGNELGRRVKIMDLKDNIAKVRKEPPTPHAEKKLSEYEEALTRLS